MKSLKEKVLEFVRKNQYAKTNSSKGVTTKEIALALEIQRSYVSSLLNELIKEEKLEKTNTRPVLYKLSEQIESMNENYCFSELTGHDGSLRNVVQLTKAAILYPQKSLNLLISSKPGCGTTYFATLIHRFAVENKILETNAPFIKINCNHYSKNISVLDEELFGDNNTHSCFEKARGGTLFIDGFDVLDAKQQSRILSFLETSGLYINDDIIDYSDVYLLLSTTPNAAHNLVRKIPVIIELPELNERPFSERLELIHGFFEDEVQNSKRNIKVTNEVIKALLLTEYPFNIKELRNEIISACANAYVRVVNDLDEEIYVCITDLNARVKRSLLLMKEYREALDRVLGTQEYFIYGINLVKNQFVMENVYSNIKMQYNEMTNHGVASVSVEEVINKYIQNFFDMYSYNIKNENQDLEQLSKIIDRKIISLVSTSVDNFQKEMNKKLKSNVFYGLCFHINSLLTQNIGKERVNNNQIVEVIQNCPNEYAIAAQLVAMLKKVFSLDLDIAETVIIALFFIDSKEDNEENKPVLLYIMHGYGTAKSLCDVTNSLTHCNNAYSYDLTLESQTEVAMEEIKTLIKKIDCGSGVIVIYDMGSIKTMLEAIQEEISTKIRYINVPITLIGIDIARKCAMESDIDLVYHSASLELRNDSRQNNVQKDVIITSCHTGEGGAMQLKNHIDSYSHLGMRTIALSISNRNTLIQEVTNIRKVYNIHAFVGTYDPKILGVPFIPISSIFETNNENIDRVLLFEPVNVGSIDYNQVYDNFTEQFKFTPIAKLKTVLPPVVDELSLTYNLNKDQTLGVFVHIACLIERLLANEPIGKNSISSNLFNAFEEDSLVISKMMKKIEKTFKIIVDDNEIATIVMMVKRI